MNKKILWSLIKLILVGILLAIAIFLVFCSKADGAGKDKTDAASVDKTEVVSEDKTDVTSEDKTEETTEAISETAEQEVTKMEPATLLYQGHASIRITTAEGKVIYVDPFMGTGYDEPADLILITHGHYDHTNTDLIKVLNKDCKTITQKEALKDGVHQNFDLGYVSIEAVEAGYNKNHNEKECVGYILTFSNGVTLYLSGDTSTTPQMSQLSDRALDYAFFCCDGVYNMDVKEASECAKLVNAKHTIPYHMVPSSNTNGFDMSVAESFDAPGRIILEPGQEIKLE